VDSYWYLALGIVPLYARGGQFVVSGTWYCTVIGQGWTVSGIWHLVLYRYRPGVDS